MDALDPIWPILSALLGLGLFLIATRAWGRSLTHGGRVDRAAWEMYAAERDHDYMPDPLHPRLRGVHDGVSIEASAVITRRRSWRGRRTASESARSFLRATHRADLPRGFSIRRARWVISLSRRLFGGGQRVEADHPELEGLRVEADDPERARDLLDDPDLRAALARLFEDLPEAVVHDRAIEARLPGMASDTAVLDAYFDRMTAVAKALRRLSPQVDRAAAAPSQQMVTAADLPRRAETLAAALRRVANASNRTSQNVQASTLRIKPYEYELEVRAITEGSTRLGVPTGGRLVRGVLRNSPWRAEVVFGPEDNDAVDDLEAGDVITGMCLVDDLRQVARTVEATAETPPIVVDEARAPGAEE